MPFMFNPCKPCCGGVSSSSCCSDCPDIPDTLHVTFTSLSDCFCLFGVTAVLTRVANPGDGLCEWQGTPDEACGLNGDGEPAMHFSLTSVDPCFNGDLSHWHFTVTCDNGGGDESEPVESDLSCDPLYLKFILIINQPSCGSCSGIIQAEVTI